MDFYRAFPGSYWELGLNEATLLKMLPHDVNTGLLPSAHVLVNMGLANWEHDRVGRWLVRTETGELLLETGRHS